MSKRTFIGWTHVALLLAAASPGCGPDKPTGSGGEGGSSNTGGEAGSGGSSSSSGMGGSSSSSGMGGSSSSSGLGGSNAGGMGGMGGMSNACIDGDVQCGAAGVETCNGGTWATTSPCPQGCSAGTCSSGATTCTPGALQCFGNSVKECNQAGTAWVSSSLCLEQCVDGLCVGGCTPGEFRCNGATRQTCNAGGTGWTDESTCALGCAQTVCVENELNNQGNNVTLSGKHVYQGCVALSFNGSIIVPAGMTLEIWAKCLTMTPGTSVSLGTGAAFRFHASETIDLAGTLSGGDDIWLAAWKSLVNNASIQSGKVTLRADVLTNGASGQVTGNASALHGISFTNNGSFTGTVSVMPPEELSSVTNPDAGWWNFDPEGIDISWDKPFPGVIGYYTQVGNTVPGPGNGTLAVPEHVTIAPERLRPGLNTIRVVSVNSDSVVGTYPVDLDLYVNMKPPNVTSMSHPNEGEWTPSPDVFMSWTDPAGPPPGTFIGYRYIWDKRADTIPTAPNATFRF